MFYFGQLSMEVDRMVMRLDTRTETRTGRLSGEGARLRLHEGARLRRYRQYQDFYEGRHFERPRNGRSSLVLKDQCPSLMCHPVLRCPRL